MSITAVLLALSVSALTSNVFDEVSNSTSVFIQLMLPRMQAYQRTHILGYFICLLASNVVQSTGTAMNIRWVTHGGVFAGGFCSAQGVCVATYLILVAMLMRISDQVESNKPETLGTLCGRFLKPRVMYSRLTSGQVVHNRRALVQPPFPSISIDHQGFRGNANYRMGPDNHDSGYRAYRNTVHGQGPVFWDLGQLVRTSSI